MSTREIRLKRRVVSKLVTAVLAVVMLLVPGRLPAGELDPSLSYGPPDEASSAMYTLEDIYQRLFAGTEGSVRTGGFTDPTSVGVTMHTLDDIMGAAPPYADNTSRADDGDVCSGLDYWALRADNWGSNTGSKDCNAPSFSSTEVTGVNEDAAYTYNITATDTEGVASLTITAPALPDWLGLTAIFGTGVATLSGTPDNDDVGDHDVSLLVTDGGGLTDTQNFTVTVSNTDDDPSFTSSPILTVAQGALYIYTVTTADVDGDSLTITAPVKPGWLTMGSTANNAATLHGTAPSSTGTHNVTLRVSDGGAPTVDQVFVINVP